MELHEKIQAARVISRMSQEEMAARIGVSQNFLSKMERGKAKITATRLLKIVQAVGRTNGIALLKEDNCQREAVSFAQWIILEGIRIRMMSFQVPNERGGFTYITEENLYLKFKESIS